MKISLIAAVAENGVIGRGGALPWHLPADLEHFKSVTTGHHILMGRRTWESLGRPLPGRQNIVLSGQPGFSAAGARVAPDFAAALEIAETAGESECFVIGGAGLYATAMPHADRIYLTEVLADVPGDVSMPAIPGGVFQETAREEHGVDEKHLYSFRFLLLDRIRPPEDA